MNGTEYSGLVLTLKEQEWVKIGDDILIRFVKPKRIFIRARRDVDIKRMSGDDPDQLELVCGPKRFKEE